MALPTLILALIILNATLWEIKTITKNKCSCLLLLPNIILPCSQAVLVDRTLYISGQVGMDPASGQLVEGGVQAQTRQVGYTECMT